MSNKGLIIVISGPSGSGKTTLCRMVEERLKIPHSVSYTTRHPRVSESPGKDYHFISEETFNEMVDEKEFLEWAEVHGRRYGTSERDVQKIISKGQDIILDLDTQGALAIKKIKPQSVLIFVDVPDTVLQERLGKRGTENPEILLRRLESAKAERNVKAEYDHQLLNETLEKTFEAILKIIEKERELNRIQ